jgi:small subunit ribosomal protein S18
MASKKNKARSARDANPRKFKKKTSILLIEKVEFVDYKDVDLLSRFMSDRAKIKNRRVAGNDLQQQRLVANAIKVAREMALLPYAKRVASTRTGGRRGDRDDKRGGDRDEEKSLDTSDDVVDTTVEGADEAAVDAVDSVESESVVDTEVTTDETAEV